MTKKSKMSRFEMLQMVAELQRLRKDQKGGITILTLLLLITMLIMSGMAVDFMRYETERVKLQSVTDRSVLAAADLTADNPEATIKDFFATAGYDGHIIGSPVIVANPGARSVSVRSEVDLNTFYLRLAGIDLLQAPATAEALEGIGKVEIALVLDISQSMAGAKIDTLYKAAEEFAFRVLLNPERRKAIAAEQAYTAARGDPTYTSAQMLTLENDMVSTAAAVPGSEPTQVALTIVPYAGAVNPGPWMFNYLGTNRLPASDGGTTISSCPHLPRDASLTAQRSEDNFNGPEIEADMSISNMRNFTLINQPEHPTRPLGTDWKKLGLPQAGLTQIPHFDFWGNNKTFTHAGKSQTIDFGWCPSDATTTIQWAMSDPTEATKFVRQMEMYDGTGTDYAVKWGLAALDPLSRPAFDQMRAENIIGKHLTGIPADWDDVRSRKVMVVMTDGGITGQRRPDEDFGHWGDESHRTVKGESIWETREERARANFMTQCDLAREKDVEVYTVAYQLTDVTDSLTLEYCASRETNIATGAVETKHFDATGDELITIFKNIANSITELRLSK